MHHLGPFALLALLENFFGEIPCVDFLTSFLFILLHVNILYIKTQEALKYVICMQQKTEQYIFTTVLTKWHNI
jgi:hypothetical protein